MRLGKDLGASRAVELLAAQGITPEPVEIPGITIENGIAEMPDGRGLWIKDPDGNLIAVFQRAVVPAATGS